MTYKQRFNGHYPGKPGLADSPLRVSTDPMLSILNRPAKTLHIPSDIIPPGRLGGVVVRASDL